MWKKTPFSWSCMVHTIYLPITVTLHEPSISVRCLLELLFHWCFEPSQPLWIISGLKTNFNPSVSNSPHKSFNTNQNISIAKLFHSHTHTCKKQKTNTHTHNISLASKYVMLWFAAVKHNQQFKPTYKTLLQRWEWSKKNKLWKVMSPAWSGAQPSGQGKSTMAQWAKMTVNELSLINCVWAHFPVKANDLTCSWHQQLGGWKPGSGQKEYREGKIEWADYAVLA